MAYYDKYWDKIRVEQARIDDIEEKYAAKLQAKDKALAQERQKAEAERQKAQIEHKNLIETAKLLLSLQVDIVTIAKKTGLSEQIINQLDNNKI